MASITERQGRYWVRVRRQGFSGASKTFARRADAIAWARRVESDLDAGHWRTSPPAIPGWREAVREYREHVAPAHKGASTYRYRYDEFEKLSFANEALDRVTPGHIARWRDQQLTRFKPGTVCRKLAMLSSIFTWAMKERGWVTTNPVASVKKPRVADARSRTLSDLEVRLLMEAASTSKARWLLPALTVLIHSAMRRGELFGLKAGDVDLDLGVACLHDTKNGERREVPLCPRSLGALQGLRDMALAGDRSALIPIGAAGSLSTRFTVTVRRARALYEAECVQVGQEPLRGVFADLRLHDLRHHAITAWASSGSLSLVELMAVSGHKTPRMLTRYTHLQAATLAKKLAALNR